jgi:N-acetyl-gamma-glutamyl-phosphate reductase
MTFSVAVAGASGYAGGELLRLLAGHAEFEVTTVTAHSNAGAMLTSVHPHLREYAHLRLVETTPENLAGHDIVFLTLPHGASGAISAQLPADTLVVDCGADHRLDSKADWEAFYGGEYSGAWTYGIPEMLTSTGSVDLGGNTTGFARQRENLVGARRIAAPGCNASAVSLALGPGLATGALLPSGVTATLAVGPSGAGKAARVDLLASEIMGSANPYAVGHKHRHIPEILQNMRKALIPFDGTSVGSTVEPSLTLTPVIVPMARGILAVVTAQLAPEVTLKQLLISYIYGYENEPFVDVLPMGTFPRSGDTTGANTCLIGFDLDEKTGHVTIIAALDNLTKGTAGAAIQSANIALGLPEGMGLSVNGVAP